MVHGIIWWIVVGLIAGWAAGKIMKGGGYGVVADILLGIVGGIVGGWIVGFFGGGGGGFISSILVAILGAVVLIWLTRLPPQTAGSAGTYEAEILNVTVRGVVSPHGG